MHAFLKIQVGKEIWLVPLPLTLATPEFKNAVDRFNRTSDGEIVSFTDEEYLAFVEIQNHPATWKPF